MDKRLISSKGIEQAQRAICTSYHAPFVPAFEMMLLGFASETEGRLPWNGLRNPEAGDSCGWFLWCGEEFSEASDFFKPMHVLHIHERFPEVGRFLGLPPGYRFLVAGEYIDVWFDENLLID